MSHPQSKIFGIGLSRTGTTSLTSALRILGYQAIHYPLAILSQGNDGFLKLNTRGVEQYDALTDIPVSRFYKELDQAFPHSKFILTVRSTESWITSMRRLARSFGFLKWFPKVEQLFYEVYGVRTFEDEHALCARYKSYNQEVIEYFAGREKDLLVLDLHAGDSWQKLCTFLGRPVPEGTPFPWHNRKYVTIYANIIDFFNLRK